MLGAQITVAYPCRAFTPGLAVTILQTIHNSPPGTYHHIATNHRDTWPPLILTAIHELAKANEQAVDIAEIDSAGTAARSRGHILAVAAEAGSRTVAMIDDDATVISEDNWPAQFDLMLHRHHLPWATGLIRFAENIGADPHTRIGPPEKWTPVMKNDPNLEWALARYSPSANRMYDVDGTILRGTALLGGTCFAVAMHKVAPWMIERLRQWPAGAGDEDMALGNWLGVGAVASRVEVIHYGTWADGGWQEAPMALLQDDRGAIHPDILQWRDAIRDDLRKRKEHEDAGVQP